MSQLWPDGADKSLLLAVIHYLENLRTHKSVESDNKEELGVAIDCLRSIEGETTASLPFTLEQLYEQYRSQLEKPSNKHRERFLQFLSALNEKGYFKQAEDNPEQYQVILEQARLKYNQRCPTFEVGPLDALKITRDEIEQVGKASAASTASSNTNNTDGNTNVTQPSSQKRKDDDTKQQTKKQTETIVEEKEISAEAKKKAEEYKTEGNQLLASNQHKEAIAKYTSAIEYDPTNAVYYCNRAAAYTYIKKFENAVNDAREALRRDNKYVKAYVRLGVAEMERGNLETARDAYQEAVNLTKTSDPSWDSYLERLEHIKQKIELEKNKSTKSGRNVNPSGGGGSSGGGADLGNLMDSLSQLGGGGGLAGLLNNPMMQQMAQQMMSNPQMMQQMSEFMNNPDSMSQIQNIMGDPSFQNLAGDTASSDTTSPDSNSNDTGASNTNDMSAMQDMMKLFMQNPEKAKQAMQEALSDPSIRNDPEINQLVQQMKSGDMGAVRKLASKPHVVAALKKAMNSPST